MENKYKVKGVISGIGHDLMGFKATLYCDNKKIAVVSDSGLGGGYEYYWENKKAETDFEKFIENEKVIREKNFKPITDFEKKYGFIFDCDIFIEELVKQYETDKYYKRLCKKNVIFQIDDDIGTDKYLIMKNIKYDENSKEKITQFLKSKYKNNKLKIINSVYL